MVDEWGRVSKDQEEPVDNLITWVFEEGTFKPAAKLVKGKAYSILTDYLGTPKEAYDWWANKVWAIELEAYGKVKSCEGWLGTPAEESFIPFRFQGQYHDVETGLYYNRFRYYSPEEGMYVTAQDPIGLEGGSKLYSYVYNPNGWVDVFGLTGLNEGGFSVYALVNKVTQTPYYIGLSNNDARRLTEHIDSGRFDPDIHEQITLERDLKFKEARGFEQAYIEHYETKTGVIGEEISATNKGNKINSFDKNRTDKRGKAFNKEYKKAKKKIKCK